MFVFFVLYTVMSLTVEIEARACYSNIKS